MVSQHKINQNSIIQWHPRCRASTEIHLIRHIALRASKITPGRPQGASKPPQELPIDAPKRPHDGNQNAPKTGLRRLPGRTSDAKMAQEAPRSRTAPLQTSILEHFEPPSTPPDFGFEAFWRRVWSIFKNDLRRILEGFSDDMPPRGWTIFSDQGAPRHLQDGPWRPKTPQGASKTHQEAS